MKLEPLDNPFIVHGVIGTSKDLYARAIAGCVWNMLSIGACEVPSNDHQFVSLNAAGAIPLSSLRTTLSRCPEVEKMALIPLEEAYIHVGASCLGLLVCTLFTVLRAQLASGTEPQRTGSIQYIQSH